MESRSVTLTCQPTDFPFPYYASVFEIEVRGNQFSDVVRDIEV